MKNQSFAYLLLVGFGILSSCVNVTNNSYASDDLYDEANRSVQIAKVQAAKAAKDAGKPFDPAAYKKALIDAETERLLAGTSKATIPTATPTGGKLGGGTFDPTRWGNVEVVTPK